MVADRGHDRAVRQAAGVEPLQDAADLVVHVGNLPRIGAIGKPRLEGFRRIVRRVRVVEVQPGEEALRRVLVQPGCRVVDHFTRAARHVAERDRLVLRHVELVDVRVEPAVQPPFRVENEGAHERARLPASVLEDAGQRRVPAIEDVSPVVADAMLRGQQAGEDRGVRRQGQRRRGKRLLEQHPLGRQPIQVWRGGGAIAVRPEPIPPRRVERDEDDVQLILGNAADDTAERRAAGRCRGSGAAVQDPGRGGDDGNASDSHDKPYSESTKKHGSHGYHG